MKRTWNNLIHPLHGADQGSTFVVIHDRGTFVHADFLIRIDAYYQDVSQCLGLHKTWCLSARITKSEFSYQWVPTTLEEICTCGIANVALTLHAALHTWQLLMWPIP